MGKTFALAFLSIFLCVVAVAADKEAGNTALKDVQPAGTTDKKHKKQQYDLTFVTAKHEYTCRTKENEKVEATNFVVGTGITYKIDGNKGQVKSTQSGKNVKCTLVRVAAVTSSTQ
jgi:hypothetical protein